MSLSNKLFGLELLLHKKQIRSNESLLNAILHDNFIEFGRSGKVYTKELTLKLLPKEHSDYSIIAQNLVLNQLSPNCAQILYKSAHVNEKGLRSDWTNRSSIWVFTKNWQMVFHQGTPTN